MTPVRPATVEFKALGSGRFQIVGVLGFDTVKALLAASRPQFAGLDAVEIDLADVSHGDSAGLALLIEWLRLARSTGQRIHYTGIPEQLRALARISEVEDLLS